MGKTSGCLYKVCSDSRSHETIARWILIADPVFMNSCWMHEKTSAKEGKACALQYLGGKREGSQPCRRVLSLSRLSSILRRAGRLISILYMTGTYTGILSYAERLTSACSTTWYLTKHPVTSHVTEFSLVDALSFSQASPTFPQS